MLLSALGNITPQRTRTRSMLVACAVLLFAAANPAQALPTSVLPGAVSYEYFGLNFAENIATSNSVGVLNYDGKPGCAGNCTAITALGVDPSVTVNVAELPFDATGGGFAEAQLSYYVQYNNSVPGVYNVNLYAHDTLPAIASGFPADAQAYLAFGLAYPPTAGSAPQFESYEVNETDCANYCAEGVANYTSPKPFPAVTAVQMTANVPYLVEATVWIGPGASGTQFSASIDPTFSTDATGGSFSFSPGISAVPEPDVSALVLLGLAGFGFAARRRRR